VDLRGALAALRASWWLPLAGLIAGAGLALVGSLLQTPAYQSSTQLFVSTLGSISPADAYQGSQFSESRVKSYAQLITSDELARRVIDSLDLEMAPGTLKHQITATAAADTVLVYVTVTDPSPQRAQQIAGAVGTEFTAMAAELETPRPGSTPPVKVTVTQQPYLPTVPSSPNTVRNVFAGLVIGMLAGIGAALGRGWLDHTVKTAGDVAELMGAPVIGTVQRDAEVRKRHLVDRTSTSRTAEDYRQLSTSLQLVRDDEAPKIIMLSSAAPLEGTTTAVVNLALLLARAGKKVTIVEANLRRPKVTPYMGLLGRAGLSNVLVGTAEIDDVIQHYSEGLSVIAAGPLPPNPGELLASGHMAAVFEKLRGENDFVLVDAPPLLPVADASTLATFTDGVLLIVRYGSTDQEQLREAADRLRRAGVETLGVILNVVPRKAEMATALGYEYSYG
jgi:receptor protein-tyrosine kinase